MEASSSGFVTSPISHHTDRKEQYHGCDLETQIPIRPDVQKTHVDFSEILNAIQEIAKDVNIIFDELEEITNSSKDDDSLLHHGNLTSTSDNTSRLESIEEDIPEKNKSSGLYF
ncbi:PREDICTED: anoctamin-4-like, partial [Thamnophis sirtalis]